MIASIFRSVDISSHGNRHYHKKACGTEDIDVDYILAGKECNVHGKKERGLVWS